jgi:hypothetical protein
VVISENTILSEQEITFGRRKEIRHLEQFIVLNSYLKAALSGKNEGSNRVF